MESEMAEYTNHRLYDLTIPPASGETDVRKGTWLTDVTYDDSPAGTAVGTITNTDSLELDADGTSNTIMIAEKHMSQDGAHVLTSVQHASQTYATGTGFMGGVFVASGDVDGAEDSLGLWQINAEPARPFSQPVTFTATISNLEGTVATETITIAHEGLLLG
jgi:hypothetical protein